MFSLFDICWQSILCFVTKERGGSRTCREGFESKPLDGNTHSSWRIDSVAVSLFVSSDRSSHSDDVLLSAPTGRVAVEKPEWQPRVYQTVLMESFRFLICQKVKGERGRILEKFDFAHFSRATTLACRVFVQEILGTPQFRIYASLEFTQPDLTQPESLISPNENCNHHYHKLNATFFFPIYFPIVSETSQTPVNAIRVHCMGVIWTLNLIYIMFGLLANQILKTCLCFPTQLVVPMIVQG